MVGLFVFVDGTTTTTIQEDESVPAVGKKNWGLGGSVSVE